MKNQIFISYRRNGGEAMAQLLYDRLKNSGYAVFYDIESLTSGLFNKKLYSQIEECDDFLLILPPQALDRCVYEEDWVRCEIRHALKHQKNIIPIMMRDFVFPDNLPADIAAVKDHNGVQFESMGYIDAKVDKLISMLKSKPDNQPHYPEQASSNSLVRNVCSLGTCDFDNPFPNDAHFSEVINRDQYNIIRFHVTTAPIKDKDRISTSLTIFDSNNNIVFNEVIELDWKPSYNILTRSWVIRDRDGSFVKSDTYRAEFRVENSSVYEYYFKITSQNDSKLKLPSMKSKNENKAFSENQSEFDGFFKAPPKGVLLHLLTTIIFVFTFSLYSSRNSRASALIFVIPLLLCYIRLIKFTRRYVAKNIFLALLFCTVFYFYYGAYLLISAVINAFKSARKQKNQ